MSAILIVLGLGLTGDPGEQERIDFFEKKIRPVLVAECYECHSAAKAKVKGGLRLDHRGGLLRGGDGGAAVVPGEPKASRLLSAIEYRDRDLAMPPRGKLSDAVIADFARWIEMGAPDPRDQAPQAESEEEAPYDFAKARTFWSFQPVVEPELPRVADTAWPSSPLDRFVLANLEANRLRPAPRADRRTLLRRVSFDLAGLPPTSEEIDAFLSDKAPGAFARLVDRLLASPRYGERWGRHWLDVVRYADSNGLDENIAYANAFRYRDYVIDSFNRDKPYDLFLREQIAGDLMPDEHDPLRTIERQVATGFLSVGAKMLADDDQVKKKLDIVDEQIDAIGRAFLGLSIGCARCHDHKFEPIPTEDYYSLAGIFTSTRTMETLGVVARWYERALLDPKIEARREIIQEKIDAKDREFKGFVRTTNARLVATERDHVADYLLAASEVREPRDRWLVEAEDFARGDVERVFEGKGEGIGIITKKGAGFAEYVIRLRRAGTYHVELRYAATKKRPLTLFVNGEKVNEGFAGKRTGGSQPKSQRWLEAGRYAFQAGINTIRLERSDRFAYIDKLRIRPEGPDVEGEAGTLAERAARVAAARELKASFLVAWADTLDGAWIEGEPEFARWFEAESAVYSAEGDAGDRRRELRELAAWYEARFDAAEMAAKKEDEPDPQLAAFRKILQETTGPFAPPENIEKDYSVENSAEHKRLMAELAAVQKSLPEQPHAMGVTEDEIANLRVHLRGNYLTLGDEAPRRLPRMFFANFKAPELSDEESGRRELAEWITSRRQPLTARVLVNRLWRWHFGSGIVSTTENFGTRGAPPSNQALLDWLALRFVESGWSIKAINRLILLSSTYRMSTAFNAQAFRVDPENRLQWRFQRRRLEAEPLRDALLALSDDLDLAMGGTLLKIKNHAYVTGRRSNLTDEYETERRSVYMPVIRSALFEMFQAFDFADPSTTNGDRVTTTVAPQALFLMNSELVARQSGRLADKLLGGELDDPSRVRAAYGKIYGRPASEDDIARALEFLKSYDALSEDEGMEDARRHAWQAFCRALMGSNEFLYVE